ncbi:MAG: hypothetical protein SVX38_04685 [Chloroflexota bacterium]|nr:hypothetical protein [Chloroflexota bacterium]
MSYIPSIPSTGLRELIVLAGIAGLVALIVVIAVVIMVKGRKRDDTNGSAGAGSSEAEVSRRKSRGAWKWIVILVLLAVLVLPLFAVFFGVLAVTPVTRRVFPADRSGEPVIVAIQTSPSATSQAAVTPPAATPTNEPRPTTAPAYGRRSGPALLSLNPQSTLDVLVILPIVASVVLFIGATIVAVILKMWPRSNTPSKDADGDEGKWPWLRYALLALTSWVALSGLLILDLEFAVSLYLQFVAIYAAFWILVGALLLYSRPMREKLLILALFLAVIFAVRLVDWNSRKPFLRSLYRIEEGMTAAQVDQIMDDYLSLKGSCPDAEVNEQGEIVTGTVTYRHTNEGWGNSDWGVITFENGHVVQKEFLPD